MAYSNITFAKLKSLYGLQHDHHGLGLQNTPPVMPRPYLLEYLEGAKQMAVGSEKARSEFLIAPVFLELQRLNGQITLFSGTAFNIEGEENLTGTPDFMISARPRLMSIEAPVFCMVEAKNGVVEDGYAQCAAEMYAARLFNRQAGEPHETIFGAVTNAYEWVFLKLEGDVVYIDTDRYFLNDLPKILGILQFIVDQYKTKTK